MPSDVDDGVEQSLSEANGSEESPAVEDRSPRVLVVSQVRLVREGIAEMLRARGLSRIVLTNGTTVLDDVRKSATDVVILDVARPSMFPIMHALAEHCADVRVIALGVGDSDAEILACAEAGAAGYLPLESGADELMDSIASARRDELVCSPRIAALLFRRQAARNSPPTNGDSGLTRREQEVLALVDDGLSNKEIAARLHISLTTVKNHVHRILEKLQVHRRGAAAARLHASASRPTTLSP